MAKLSTLVAALAILAFTGSAAFAGCAQHTAQTAQGQTSVQTAEQPQQTTKPTTTKSEDAAQ